MSRRTGYFVCICLLVSVSLFAGTEEDTDKGDSIFNRMIDFANAGQLLQLEEEYPDAVRFFHQHEQWASLYIVLDMYIVLLLQNQEYQKATDVAFAYYKEARKDRNEYAEGASAYLIGMIYGFQKRYDEAEPYLREAIGLLQKQTVEESQELFLYVYGYLADLLLHSERYEETLDVIRRMEALPFPPSDDLDSYINTFYLNTYLLMEKYDSAWVYMNRMESVLSFEIVRDVTMLENKVLLLEHDKRYPEAIALLDTILTVYGESNYAHRMLEWTLPQKARIARLAGEYDLSIDTYERIIQLTDSTNRVEVNARLDELRTRYEVERHVAEKERNRGYLLLAVTLCVVLLVALSVWILYSRRVTLKNRGLVRRIREQDRLEEELERERAEKLQYKKMFQSPGEVKTPTENEDELFLELQKQMREEQLYTDNNFGRKEIAERLGTNERYLQDTVKKNLGITFHEYLTTLRLNHARELLARQGNTLTNEAIAIDSGLGSRSSFYRLFRDHYGLTPEEFKKLINEKQADH